MLYLFTTFLVLFSRYPLPPPKKKNIDCPLKARLSATASVRETAQILFISDAGVENQYLHS